MFDKKLNTFHFHTLVLCLRLIPETNEIIRDPYLQKPILERDLEANDVKQSTQRSRAPFICIDKDRFPF